MAVIKVFLLFPLLGSFIQALPASPVGDLSIADKENPKSAVTAIVTYTIDYFLVRKELQYALQDVIAYKEATTSRLDPLPNPPTDSENEIRWILDGLRVTSFYAYDKLIFLANSNLLTLSYATQTFGWYEKTFFHFTGKIGQLIAGLDDSVKVEIQSLLDQIVSQTNQHHYLIKLLLTTS